MQGISMRSSNCSREEVDELWLFLFFLLLLFEFLELDVVIV